MFFFNATATTDIYTSLHTLSLLDRSSNLPGRPAVLQRQVVAAARPDEDLRAPVLVEEENRRRRLELLHLAQQEVDQCGLAGIGLADDHGGGDRLLPEGVLTGVGGGEVDVVRRAIGGVDGKSGEKGEGVT